MIKTKRLITLLKKEGFNPILVKSSQPDVEDDQIEFPNDPRLNRFSIQISKHDTVEALVEKTPNETFLFTDSPTIEEILTELRG